jgi:cytochrome c-type biogenesis protein CcmH/NrfG
MKRSVVALVVVTLLAVVGTSLYSQAQAQGQTQIKLRVLRIPAPTRHGRCGTTSGTSSLP